MIVGIDPGMRKVALCYTNSAIKGVRTFVVPQAERGEELWRLSDDIHTFVDLLCLGSEGPLSIFCEAPIVGMSKNYQTAIKIAETVGMILALPYPTYTVAPGTWKKAVVGNGSASKAQVADWLREVKPDYFKLCDGDQDLADAACIALYGEKVRYAALDLGRPGSV